MRVQHHTHKLSLEGGQLHTPKLSLEGGGGQLRTPKLSLADTAGKPPLVKLSLLLHFFMVPLALSEENQVSAPVKLDCNLLRSTSAGHR